MNELIKILARIQLNQGKGGRQTPISSGYRPIFFFPNARTNLSGSIKLLDREAFGQGDLGEVQITFLKGIIDDVHFRVGEHFTFGEGPYPVGEGEITKLINA